MSENFKILTAEESKIFFKQLRSKSIEKLRSEMNELTKRLFPGRDLSSVDELDFFLFAYQLGQAHLLESLEESAAIAMPESH